MNKIMDLALTVLEVIDNKETRTEYDNLIHILCDLLVTFDTIESLVGSFQCNTDTIYYMLLNETVRIFSELQEVEKSLGIERKTGSIDESLLELCERIHNTIDPIVNTFGIS